MCIYTANINILYTYFFKYEHNNPCHALNYSIGPGRSNCKLKFYGSLNPAMHTQRNFMHWANLW